MEWGESASDAFRIECSNSINCKQWPRIYANTKTHAIRLWNKAMENNDQELEQLENES
jgi:hypothetical protein